jgi:hypothetical protein
MDGLPFLSFILSPSLFLWFLVLGLSVWACGINPTIGYIVDEDTITIWSFGMYGLI